MSEWCCAVRNVVWLPKLGGGEGNLKACGCDGVHLLAISATCLVAVETCEDCHSSFSCNTHHPVCASTFLCFFDHLAQEQTGQFPHCDFIHVAVTKKGSY